jgi:hypothetical protein
MEEPGRKRVPTGPPTDRAARKQQHQTGSADKGSRVREVEYDGRGGRKKSYPLDALPDFRGQGNA